MRAIINFEKIDRKFKRKQARKEWWFRFRKLKKAVNKIAELYSQACNKAGKKLSHIYIYPSDFKKMNKEEVELTFNICKKDGAIKSFNLLTNDDSKDVYMVEFYLENAPQERFLKRFPEEIDLNATKLEPLPQLEQKTTHSEQATKLSDDEIFDAINKARHLERVKELPSEKMLDAKIPVHSTPTNEDDEDISKPF